ncbi:MAG: hypothetical protein MJK18_12815, partial [Bdellovibrionales bacterium]|nr:hypothetical protein [Bdellovibrionales bacterium]
MGIKNLKLFLLGFLFFNINACTSGGGGENVSDELLDMNTVFSASQSSFSNSDEVLAFDGQNRPVLNSEKKNCDPTLPPNCETGFQLDEEMKSCVPICEQGQVYAQEQCHDRVKTCEVENGEGTQSWMANSYGDCTVSQCEDAYELKDNECVAKCTEDEVYHNGECKPLIADCRHKGKKGSKVWDGEKYGKCHTARDCKVAKGKGVQDWIPETQKYGRCEVVSCRKDHKIENNRCVSRCSNQEVFNGKRCVPLVKECEIAGGHGKRKWKKRRKRYGSCRVVSCNEGFVRRGNSCISREELARRRECDPLIIDMGSDVNNAQGIDLTSQIDGILFDISGLNAMQQAHDKKQISLTQQEH